MALKSIGEAPCELACAIREFWPESEWDNAASVSFLESRWDAFAVDDSRTPVHPCNAVIDVRDGVPITAEFSIGYFQINACNFPDWPWERFFNARHNAGTAHDLWVSRRWRPWFFSATQLGLL